MTFERPTVQVAGGAIAGRCDAGVRTFLGIPYAAPPFGRHRLQPPHPVASWRGVKDARSYGPTVPKSRFDPHFERMFPERWIPGEECLNLNVWTPSPDASLPVLVWIHGGGFTNGSGSSAEIAGDRFARSGVVCVTINYRLAADGFLFLDDGIANLGLLDQLAALRWVQENIAAFGGDPLRVTLGGHSAGGSSVACLLSMAGTAGLFSQAISQSTSGVARLTSRTMAERVAANLASRLGVPMRRAALAAVPVDRFVRASGDLIGELHAGPDPDKWGPEAATLAPFAPTLDGVVLSTSPIGDFAAGRHADVRLLTGTVREETRLHLTPDGIEATTEEDLLAAAQDYGLDADGLDCYRSNRPNDGAGDLLSAVTTDWYFRRPTVQLAEARVAAGAADTWVYRVDRPLRKQNAGYGACHGVEVPFVFATTDVGETHARIGSRPSARVQTLLHQTWVDFIVGQEPGWPRFDTTDRITGVLSDRLAEVADPDGPEREAWSQFK